MNDKNDFQMRRFSLKELSVRAQKEIYKHIRLFSQDTESFRPMPVSSYKLSQPFENGLYSSPDCCLHRYESQKFVPLRSNIESSPNVQPKKFTINTFSLKQVQSIKGSCSSLPKIKKRSPKRLSEDVRELEWITPEEIMARKLIITKKKLPKIPKEVSQAILQKQPRKGILNSLRNDTINGWNINDTPHHDLYE